jgi:hypothetical protein
MFSFLPYNKILLEFCSTCVMFLFLLFLFHNLDLDLSQPLFLFWLENPIDLVIFVLMIISHFCLL